MNLRESYLRDLHIVDDESAFEHVDPSQFNKDSQVFTILLDHGKNTLTIDVGTIENPQKISLDLTSSFDGLALPSKIVSPEGSSYAPE
jgi:hypothetical protein